ncbi:sigma-70 family RNA polymerase sigma factor [Paraburkholderia tagetis]|uniref:Sigma-70 family RNA polymerase sigma factor n=1 Tax=Paraburkholderia tagetis TaxID=2913261 RepID=A0A9X1RNC4_9BURK|nr:sigma-70 family RNA polymerase sigma factor [Paraburkholderia tagetis]MCG5072966.1 sigma-70 family RNA polymerase sigma factor [Paraburkholderia tagetis]
MTQVIDEIDVRDISDGQGVQDGRDAAQASAGVPRDGVREARCSTMALAASSDVQSDVQSGAQSGAWSEGRRAAVFDKERARLLALAVRVLGSRAEAEDVVQDAWFRWREADVQAVRVPQAWLATATVRLAIDRLRKQRRERAGEREAPGAVPWLDGIAPSAEEGGLRAARLADGLLMLLERLGPLEQAVFVLREAFDCDYAEIAALTGCTPVHCRQIVHRARVRLVREPAAKSVAPADAAQHALAVERLREVLHAQDRAGLMDLLGVTATALVVASTTVSAAASAAASAAVPRTGTVAASGVAHAPVRGLCAEMLALDGEPGIALVAEDGELAAWLHVGVAVDGRALPVVCVAATAGGSALQAANRAFGGRAVRALLAQIARAVASGGALGVSVQVTQATISASASWMPSPESAPVLLAQLD